MGKMNVTKDGDAVNRSDLCESNQTAFEIEVVEILHPRRYPQYKVSSKTIGITNTLKKAEQLIFDAIDSEKWRRENVYSFIIYERPINAGFFRYEYVACWVYNSDGEMINKRTFPTYGPDNKFYGHTKDEIQFKWGDLVELCDGQTVSLAFVLASPHTTDYYKEKSEEFGEAYYGDETDDTYLVIDDSYCVYEANNPCSGFSHDHVDALQLFRPHFTISKHVHERYQKIWNRYLKDLEEYRKYFDAPY